MDGVKEAPHPDLCSATGVRIKTTPLLVFFLTMRTSRGSGDRGIHPRCTGILCVIKGNLLSFLKERVKNSKRTGDFIAHGDLPGSSSLWTLERYILKHGSIYLLSW